MKISKNKRFILIITFFWLLTGILFGKFAYKTGIVVTIIGLILFIPMKLDEKYLFILSAIPMAAIFKISLTVPSSLLFFYIIFLLQYYLKYPIKKNLIISSLIFIGFQILTILIFHSSINSIVSFYLNILFCITSFDYLSKQRNCTLKKCSIILGISMTINILIALIYPNAVFAISYEKQLALSMDGRFAALNGDPNYYTQLVIVAICLLSTNLLKKNANFKNNFFYICWILFFIYQGLKSLSKSFVILVLVIVIFYFISYMKNSKKDKIFILKMLVLFVFTLFVSIFFVKYILLPLFYERAQTNTTLFSNRESIWQAYFTNYFKEPLVWLIGTGIMNGANVLGEGSAAHNVYIELITETGFFGLTIIIFMLRKLIKKFINNALNVDMLFVWALLISSFALSLSSNDAFFVFLPIVALGGCLKNGKFKKS